MALRQRNTPECLGGLWRVLARDDMTGRLFSKLTLAACMAGGLTIRGQSGSWRPCELRMGGWAQQPSREVGRLTGELEGEIP